MIMQTFVIALSETAHKKWRGEGPLSSKKKNKYKQVRENFI